MDIKEELFDQYVFGNKYIPVFKIEFRNGAEHEGEYFWLQESGEDEITINMDWPNEGCPECRIKKKDARKIAKILNYFAKTGNLPRSDKFKDAPAPINLQKLVR